jgi:phosphate:Na+ symporter
MGENIGTTATANLAALGAGTEARRAALAHLLFNVFGVVWVLAVFYPFVDIVCSLVGYHQGQAGDASKLPVVLAMFHTCFNVLNTAILIGFIPQLERLVCRLMPEDKSKEQQPTTLHFISRGVIQTPEIAVLQAQKEIVHYAERMHRMFGMACALIDEKEKKEFESQLARIGRYETIADNMEIEIATYLEQVGNEHLSDETKDKKTTTVDGNAVNLTRTEFALLRLLLSNRGKVLSRQQLMDTVWAGVIVTDRTVNVNITRLRKKLGSYSQNIVSRTGFGYVFEEETDA